MESLAEYLAARDKIDGAVAAMTEAVADQMACERGCHHCCVDGLTVLTVEAKAVATHLEAHGLSAEPSPPPGGCVFLDAGGACTIYEARPVVCRTHGLPLLMGDDDGAERASQPLRVLGDVEVCALNFTERAPEAAEVLDASRLAALLLVVEQRFRAGEGLSGAFQRVPLRDVLSGDALD